MAAILSKRIWVKYSAHIVWYTPGPVICEAVDMQGYITDDLITNSFPLGSNHFHKGM